MKKILFAVALLSFCRLEAQKTLDQFEYIPFRSGKKWGAVDTNMDLKIPTKYDELGQFYFGAARARYKGKHGVIDGNQNILVPFEFDMVPVFTYTHNFGFSFVLIHDDKWGAFNEKMEPIIPFTDQYDNITYLEDSLYTDFIFVASKKQGQVRSFTLYDKNGEVLIKDVVADTVLFKELLPNEAVLIIDEDPYSSFYMDKEHTKPVKQFKNGFIEFELKVSEDRSVLALYQTNGEEILGFDKELLEYEKLKDNMVKFHCFSIEESCQDPSKYYVYNMKSKTFVFNHEFKQILHVELESADNLEKEQEQVEDLLFSIQAQKPKTFKELKKHLYLFAYSEKSPKNYILVGISDQEILFFNNDFEELGSYQISSGTAAVSEYDDGFVLNGNMMYVPITVFNNSFRGKGLYSVQENKFVIDPLYESITYDSESKLIHAEEKNYNKTTYYDLQFKSMSGNTEDGGRYFREVPFYGETEPEDYSAHYSIYIKENEIDDKILYAVYDNYQKKYITGFVNNRLSGFDCGGELFFSSIKKEGENYYDQIHKADGTVVVPFTGANEFISPSDIYENGKCYFIIYSDHKVDTPISKFPKPKQYYDANGRAFSK